MIEEGGIRARVKQSIIEDILIDLEKFKSQNVITKKDLCSLLGKLSHVSGLLVVMRPFMQPMWAAWGAPSPKDKPGCIWARQIEQEVTWFRAFFEGKGTSVERFFSLDAYNRAGTVVEIGTDASPWGMGGWLSVDGRIKEYFASPITSEDVSMYGLDTGTPAGQQVWECLAVLVALDIRRNQWADARVNLQVRSDNVTALTLLVKMRPGSPQIAIIAREIALRLVEFSFPPDAMHTPGVAHVLADELSRIHAPGGAGDVSL